MRALVLGLTAFLLNWVWPASPAAAAPRETAAAAIERIVRERHEAGARGDRAAWRRHVGPDCIWIGAGGLKTATTREVGEAQVDTGTRREIEEFVARTYGETVVATYIVAERPGGEGQAAPVRLRKLDTYVRRAGEWMLVASAESADLPPRKVAAVDPAVFDRYAGEYAGEFNAKVTVTIWRDGARLMGRDSTSSEPFELLPESQTAFFIAGDAATWIFETDAKGRAAALIYRSGASELRFRKVR